MYKKVLALLFASSLVLGACGSDEAPEETAADDTEEVAEAEPEDAEADDDVEEAIEIQEILVDDDNVKVNFYGIVKYKEGDGEAIEALFEVENKSDTDYIVQARSLSLNDKMVDDTQQFMSQEVAAGKSADAILLIQNLEGEVPDLDGNIELDLNISDKSFEVIEKVPVYIEF